MSDTDSIGSEAPADLSNPDVVTKYKSAAEISNKAIALVISLCKAGAKVVDLCSAGDNLMTELVAKIYKGKEIEKGIAFPTCVSINGVVGHFSPTEEDTTELSNGDVVKIDLGCYIDGFAAVVANTVVVQEGDAPITGEAANVIQAARIAFDAAARLIRPGKRVSDVAPVLQKVVESYGCQLVEGVMSHEMKQFIIDGSKCVLNRTSPDQKVEDAEFEEDEVYSIDIVVSSGEGKPRVLDEKQTTVYKRAHESNYMLKLKASRAVFSEIDKKYPTMPFSTRALLNDFKSKDFAANQLKLGIADCLSHGLLHPYPVLHEKSGVVAHVKNTVLLMKNGSDIVTKAPVQVVKSEFKVEDKLVKELLNTSLSTKAKKGKAKKSAAGAPEAVPL
uniref:Peptidase M24 domain-containing protein n=1 Tax=Polytomella parva TaxID=51329 RepID=A0A7S0V915_9CHLO|mmetsp:Transcript_32561/g.59085  ORF Transcript_32561/g.59085 Transcript_32561/m.59085 type:complete len:389 (+) Transcript_32561:62-1228(+)|eukprot:CAMPEP_0175076988 /NCGR_PEP_ID=MMETSP0052_2-20121109/23094_1 /TAXON_ID=51329 ORGANISM="Polytomella parva, Strain SAG 63-3" /NCGR_SAMPLE_ID=MMETSP0052_2 /ASSEMBLY_ACC=CAM_ASM_000194 /LENGTH=388 /DNA_ID=CAMNT_0016346311 /DNA_START=61 /DNA_END=1227 /DNA_ORIENTATION=-